MSTLETRCPRCAGSGTITIPHVAVERRDTRTLVSRVQTLLTTRDIEPMRAARFAARRFGVGCWARDENGRVVYVATPERAGAHEVIHGPLDWVWCPWPGCPVKTTSGHGHYHTRDGWIERSAWLDNHAATPYVLCSCGRFFAPLGWRRHRGQYRRQDRATAHLGSDPLRMRLHDAPSLRRRARSTGDDDGE